MKNSLPGDITKKEEIQRLAKELESKEPKGIHLLVNNAGITRDDNTKYSNSKPDFKAPTMNTEGLAYKFHNLRNLSQII
jgi:short-subunit dehydrogenase